MEKIEPIRAGEVIEFMPHKINLTRRDFFAGVILQGVVAKFGDIQASKMHEIVRVADLLISELDKESKS